MANDEQLIDVNIMLTIIYLAIFLVGVIGNLCNCLVIADSRNKYMKTATNYYLFSLSVSDLLLLTFGLPHDIVNLWHPTPYLFGEFVCISRGWISEASAYASVQVIVALTVERYLAICHPLKAHTMSRLSRSIKIIVLIWCQASSCALVIALQYGIVVTTSSAGQNEEPQMANQTTSKQELQAEKVKTIQCTLVERSSTLFELSVIIFFIIPMAIITILYVKLGVHLSRKTAAIRKSQKRKQQHLANTCQSGCSSVFVMELSSVNCEPASEPAQPSRRDEESDSVDSRSSQARGEIVSSRRHQLNKPKDKEQCQESKADSEENNPTSGKLRKLSDTMKHGNDGKEKPQEVEVKVVDSFNHQDQHLQLSAGLQESVANGTMCLSSPGKLEDGKTSHRSLKQQAVRPKQPHRHSSGVLLLSVGGKLPPPPPMALNSTVNAAHMQSVIKMLVSVVVMFFICWAPFHAQRLMAVYVTDPTPQVIYVYNLLNHASGISYYISALVNPILYSEDSFIMLVFGCSAKAQMTKIKFALAVRPPQMRKQATSGNNQNNIQQPDELLG